MYILLFIAAISFFVFLLSGNVKINGYISRSIKHKLIGAFAFSGVVTLFLGLPVLGIMRLFGI